MCVMYVGAHARAMTTTLHAEPLLRLVRAAYPDTGTHIERKTNVPARSRRVLVPGCGTGRLAYTLALQGFSVEASDYRSCFSLSSYLSSKAQLSV
jgi:2-polyprenyl-3-methyl-5-hydroxy-6-metoxy-1,4-benzoquinol methylase